MVVLSFIFILLTAALGTLVLASVGYLLVLLAAGAREARRAVCVLPGAGVGTARFVVIVPAHDEEAVLATTLRSLQAQDYPRRDYEVVVVADNCTDATAEIARDHGATVLERVDHEKRGKGYALAWVMERLRERACPAEAYVVVDADTWVAPDFLSQAARGLAARTDAHGHCALQGRYGVLNAGDSWRATLMAAAFDLFNHVKPLGRSRLGLSVGLKGNGMIFSRAVLECVQWRGDSVTEDIDFGLDLIRQGIRISYLPDARVLAQMPTTALQAASQRERWEGGRYRLVRERALPLLAEGIRLRSRQICDAALDLLLLPLAELGAICLVWSVLIGVGAARHLLPHPLVWAGISSAAFFGLLAYILGGLRVAGASRAAYAALARAPFYAAWKMLVYARTFRTRRAVPSSAPTAEWVRTSRPSRVLEPEKTPSEGKAA